MPGHSLTPLGNGAQTEASERRRGAGLRAVGGPVADLLLVGVLAVTIWRLFGLANGSPVHDSPFDLEPPPVRIGASLFSRGVLSDNGRHVVLSASPTCPVCRRSIGLYREISAFTERHPHWDLVVLGQENEDWLREGGVKAIFVNDQVHAATWATPTLMLVTDSGIVSDIIVGFVKADLEAQLWDRLDRVLTTLPLDNSYLPRRVTRREFNEDRVSTRRFQLVDFRRRGSHVTPHPDAVHIPLLEAERRSREELSPDRAILLDCSVSGLVEAECIVAAIPFRDAGFREIAMLVRDEAELSRDR